MLVDASCVVELNAVESLHAIEMHLLSRVDGLTHSNRLLRIIYKHLQKQFNTLGRYII